LTRLITSSSFIGNTAHIFQEKSEFFISHWFLFIFPFYKIKEYSYRFEARHWNTQQTCNLLYSITLSSINVTVIVVSIIYKATTESWVSVRLCLRRLQ
jgi:hypothetical protein